MVIKDLIHIEENIMPAETLCSFIKWLNKEDDKFQKAAIVSNTGGGQVIDERARKVKNFSLNLQSKSQTEVHWLNFLGSIIINLKKNYERKFDTTCVVNGVQEITVLKYENDGHYGFHTDHCYSLPRTLSIIILLNNEYEGGDLVFSNLSKTDEMLRIKPSAAKAIVWPSNFMYPHKVEPVTKGIRYSVVSWLL